jgi:hypothetical protein
MPIQKRPVNLQKEALDFLESKRSLQRPMDPRFHAALAALTGILAAGNHRPLNEVVDLSFSIGDLMLEKHNELPALKSDP